MRAWILSKTITPMTNSSQPKQRADSFLEMLLGLKKVYLQAALAHKKITISSISLKWKSRRFGETS